MRQVMFATIQFSIAGVLSGCDLFLIYNGCLPIPKYINNSVGASHDAL